MATHAHNHPPPRPPGADPAHPLYLFSLTGDELLTMADISRISRNDAGKLIGYQRPEVRKHIQDIVDYLNSEQVLFPNSIILALSSRVRFVRSRGPEVDDGCASAGTRSRFRCRKTAKASRRGSSMASSGH